MKYLVDLICSTVFLLASMFLLYVISLSLLLSIDALLLFSGQLHNYWLVFLLQPTHQRTNDVRFCAYQSSARFIYFNYKLKAYHKKQRTPLKNYQHKHRNTITNSKYDLRSVTKKSIYIHRTYDLYAYFDRLIRSTVLLVRIALFVFCR